MIRARLRDPRGDDSSARVPNNPYVVVIGTAVMILVGLALVASLINLWPAVSSATTTTAAGAAAQAPHTVRLMFGAVTVKATSNTALLLLVVVVGALGSLIHAATSFADFVGNQRFYSSWLVWYSMRLIVGAALALLLYFVFRGGFFSANAQETSVNPYGIAALAGLAGLFSKQATDKLREVFETLFRASPGGGDSQRKDDLANAIPTITRIDPTRVTVGGSTVSLSIYGEHFIAGTTIVRIDGTAQATTFVNTQELAVTIPDQTLSTIGSLKVTVFNGPPGGGESKPPVLLSVAAPDLVSVGAGDRCQDD